MTRIVQLLPAITPGDAVSCDALALHRLLRDAGYPAVLCAMHIAPALRDTVQPASALVLYPEDVLLYHMSTGSPLHQCIPHYRCRKIMLFHNITPPGYFTPYSPAAAARAAQGLAELRQLRTCFSLCLADSAYNLGVLREAGYTCPLAVRPLLMPFASLAQKPDAAMLRRLTADGRHNLLFVGRIAPNKRQEDLLRLFWHLHQRRPDTRLILAGSWEGMGRYYAALQGYARTLGLRDVLFTGHIRQPGLLACYLAAEVFVCMSEHEGFCVPLAEAMYFDLPVIARGSAAVPETLGGAGILSSDPREAARIAERLLTDAAFREAVCRRQRRRLAAFEPSHAGRVFLSQLGAYLEECTA